MLTDTHCHIHDAVINDRQRSMWAKSELTADKMIARALENKVTRMICVGTTLADSQRAVSFVQTRYHCFASIGIHPHEAKDGPVALEGLALLLNRRPGKIVAIGETGLDYFYNHSSKTDQITALRFQIELALEHNLPLIFHVRDAFDDFWPIFDSYRGIRGVIHSFTDSRANLAAAMERGLYVGVNGIMTFTKVPEQLQIAKEIPLQKLLLETDAPFLTPKPLRGTVNEPAYVRLVAEFLAELRGEPLADITTQTSQNAKRLFAFS